MSVEMTSMPAVEQLLDVLPALLVARAGDVRVRELVDERDLRLARQQRVDVQLLELRAAVVDALPRDDLEVADLVGRLRASVGLDEADDDVLAVVAAAAALVEHGEGLPDAGCGAEVDAERAAGHEERLRLSVERQVELEHVHAGLAEEAERATVRVLLDEPEHGGEIEAALACDANRLRARIRGRDVRVESGARSGEGVDRGRAGRSPARTPCAARRPRREAPGSSGRGWRRSSTSRRSRRRRRTAGGGSSAGRRTSGRSSASRRSGRPARRASRPRAKGTRPARCRSRRAGRRSRSSSVKARNTTTAARSWRRIRRSRARRRRRRSP